MPAFPIILWSGFLVGNLQDLLGCSPDLIEPLCPYMVRKDIQS